MENIFEKLSRVIEGYEERPGQIEMARDIEHILDLTDEDILIAEGPVGVGKSMAYLLTTINNGEFPIVISTSSHTLQNQLVGKDLPDAQEILGVDFKFADLKGISNYLCLLEYEQLDEYIEAVEDPDYNGTKPDELDGRLWDAVTTSSDICNKKCEHHEECYYIRQLKKALKADVIVVNHHLLAADHFIRTRSEGVASVLPNYNNLVIDEIHEFEEAVIGFFTKHLSKRVISSLPSRLAKAVGETDVEVYKGLSNINQALEKMKKVDISGLEQKIDEIAKANVDELIKEQFDLEEWIDQLSDVGKIILSSEGVNVQTGIREIPPMLAGFNNYLVDIVNRLLKLTTKEYGVAIWGEEYRDNSCGIKITNININGFLQGFWKESIAFVLTSATIETDFIVDRLGIPKHRSLVKKYDSPFDYKKQANLIIPKNFNPKSSSFNSDVSEGIATIIERGYDKTLLLFTSYRQMNEVVPRIKHQFKNEYTILEQDNKMSKDFLLRNFQTREKVILIGQAASFGTGVDVKGNKNIILVKLNFDPPSDPLFKAKSEAIEERGGSPFFELSIPNVITRTKQQIGRSIRSSSDQAFIAILDGRLVKSRWGKRILNSLPEMTLYNKL